MDPFSGIAILGARYGVKKIAQALAGDGAEADLAEGLVGLFAAAEQSQVRLAAIEQQLNVLVEQRYQVASSMGLRYLAQAMLGGRSDQNRADDLRRAEKHLVEASEASTTPLQRALSERMLVVARFARHDRSGAADSQVRFDLALCEAVDRAWQRLLGSGTWQRELHRALGTEDTSVRQVLKQALERARGIEQASLVAFGNANDEITAVGTLLADAVVFARMLDVPSPTRAPRPRPDRAGKGPAALEVDAVVGEPVRIGGITCTIERVTVQRYRTWSVRVGLSPRRRDAVHASWLSSNSGRAGSEDAEIPLVLGGPTYVEPGTTVHLLVGDPDGLPRADWPEEINVGVSGIDFLASA